jgi:hypothetical protein
MRFPVYAVLVVCLVLSGCELKEADGQEEISLSDGELSSIPEYQRILEAEGTFEEGMKAQDFNAAGFRLYKRQEYRKAELLWRQAIALDPEYVLPIYNLACALTLQMGEEASPNHLQEITALLHQTLALAPERIEKITLDSDLDSYRNSQAYQDFLDQYFIDQRPIPNKDFILDEWLYNLGDHYGVLGLKNNSDGTLRNLRWDKKTSILSFEEVTDVAFQSRLRLQSILDRDHLVFEVVQGPYETKTLLLRRMPYAEDLLSDKLSHPIELIQQYQDQLESTGEKNVELLSQLVERFDYFPKVHRYLAEYHAGRALESWETERKRNNQILAHLLLESHFDPDLMQDLIGKEPFKPFFASPIGQWWVSVLATYQPYEAPILSFALEDQLRPLPWLVEYPEEDQWDKTDYGYSYGAPLFYLGTVEKRGEEWHLGAKFYYANPELLAWQGSFIPLDSDPALEAVPLKGANYYETASFLFTEEGVPAYTDYRDPSSLVLLKALDPDHFDHTVYYTQKFEENYWHRTFFQGNFYWLNSSETIVAQ